MIKERGTKTQVIILSMYSDPVHVYRAFQAGAAGYVVKKSVAKEVVEAIRKVHSGGRYLSKQLVDGVLDHIVFKSTAEEKLGSLSSRERQVLQMLAEGHGVANIATTLSLSPKTVETYRARVMEKLGIHDIAGLVRFAIQQGVSPLE
jgi:DNA-binding NarL/FixJ family response regulator